MDTFNDIIQLIFFALVTYVTIIIIIRISGKRTLSKLNAFDFIVTVCLGSIMASTITDSSMPISRGLISFAALVFFQFVISKLMVKSDTAKNIILFEPALLYYEGTFNTKTMNKERISKREIYSIIRQNGFEAIDNIKAVVLETEGSISIIPYSDEEQPHDSSLDSVKSIDSSN